MSCSCRRDCECELSVQCSAVHVIPCLKSCWSLFKFVPALLKSAGSRLSAKVSPHTSPLSYQHGCGVHADASHGSEPRTAGGSSSFEEVPQALCRNTGHQTLVAIFASVWLLVFRNTTSMSNPFLGLPAVGSVIAEVTAGLVILAAKLGSIPRLFCHR